MPTTADARSPEAIDQKRAEVNAWLERARNRNQAPLTGSYREPSLPPVPEEVPVPGAITETFWPYGQTEFSFLLEQLGISDPGAFRVEQAILGEGPVTYAANATNESVMYFTRDTAPHSGMRGLHLQKKSDDIRPLGIVFEYDTEAKWDMGLDYETDDLILAYSHHASVRHDNIRLRADTAQIAIGLEVGTPANPGAHLQLFGGNAAAARDAMAITIYGDKSNLSLGQGTAGTKRTKINLNGGDWQLGTDQALNDTANFFLRNNTTALAPLTIGTNDQVAIGSTHANSEVKLVAGKLGFFNLTTPISKPASAEDLRTSLINLGLITGGANPLNLNGGALTVGAGKFSGAISGSGTAFSVGRTSLTPSSDSDITLDTTQRESWVIDVQTGTNTTGINIIIPGTTSCFYWVLNRNAQAVTLKTAAGAGIAVASQRFAGIYWPTGVNGFRMWADTVYTS